jgi:hypothetical protein
VLTRAWVTGKLPHSPHNEVDRCSLRGILQKSLLQEKESKRERDTHPVAIGW